MIQKLIGFIILTLSSAVLLTGCTTTGTTSPERATSEPLPLPNVTILVKGDTPIPDRFVGRWHEIDHVFKGSTNPNDPEVFKQDRREIGQSKLVITEDQIAWEQESRDPEESAQGLYQVIDNGNTIVFMVREVAYWNYKTGEKGFRTTKIELTRDRDVLLVEKALGSTDVIGEPGLVVMGPHVIFRYKRQK